MKKRTKITVISITALVLALALVFALVSCGADKDLESAGSSSTVSLNASDGDSSSDAPEQSADETEISSAADNGGTVSQPAAGNAGANKSAGTAAKRENTNAGNNPQSAGKNSSPYDKMATDEDYEIIAERTLYWINEFRKKEGNSIAYNIKENKAQEYAKRCVKEISVHFAHDAENSFKQRQIATDMKFGAYCNPAADLQQALAEGKEIGKEIDPEWAESVMSKKPYYELPLGEAAAAVLGSDIRRTVDALAYSFARSWRNSHDHWAYVGIRNFLVPAVIHTSTGWYAVVETSDDYVDDFYWQRYDEWKNSGAYDTTTWKEYDAENQRRLREKAGIPA